MGTVDVFVCTNLVNWTVAAHGVLQGEASRGRHAWVLYDRKRMPAPRQPSPNVRVMPSSLWTLRWLKGYAALGLIGTLYLPHHRVNKRLQWIAAHARRVAFIDDGLDTHRRSPCNVSLGDLKEGTLYYTFDEFETLPDWMRSLAVQRVCSMAWLADKADQTGGALRDFDRARHIVFDSPGVSVEGLIRACGLQPSDTLIIEHPVPAKRGLVPAGFRAIGGATVNSEAALLRIRDRQLYFGETLLLYFAARLSHPSNRLHAQMSQVRCANLVGLSFVPITATLWHVHHACSVGDDGQAGPPGLSA